MRLHIDVAAVKGVADSGDPEAHIVELLAEVGKVASEDAFGAAFLLDELQFRRRGLPQLPQLLKNAKPPTERRFDYRNIGGLSRVTAATATHRSRSTADTVLSPTR